jgi:RNA polymerase sigma-70 factor (ECF subfamily)
VNIVSEFGQVTMIARVNPLIPAVRRYLRRLCRDVDSGDDLLQDCLERVVSNWGKRRNDRATRQWFSIAHNVAVNALRQQSRRGVHLPLDDAEAELMMVEGQQDTGSCAVSWTARSACCQWRSATCCCSCGRGLTYDQAAHAPGIPVGTVMSRLSRARQRLQWARSKAAWPAAQDRIGLLNERH